MKYTIKDTRAEVNLDKRHFLAKGGEGSIYAKGDTVYKICESGKMIPSTKFKELSVLDHPNIVRPEHILLDNHGHEVGYTMKFIPNTYTLCQIFTKAFRLRNNVAADTVFDLVTQMQKTIQFIHQRKVLIVDLNELNFLLAQDFKNVWFIDVNSYQTPGYPATAIMDSIRDRQCGGVFTEGTDWFSFAIISFQMLVGIHPYRGKHPKYASLDERMRANLSVLNKAVSYPKGACQDFGVVPKNYMDWYEAVFEQGKRIPPPFDKAAVVVLVPVVKQITGSNNFDIKVLTTYIEEPVKYYYRRGTEVAVTAKSIFINNISNPIPAPIVNLGFTPSNRPIAGWIDSQKMLHLYDVLGRQELPTSIGAEKIMDYDGRIYVQSGMNIMEVIFTEISNNILPSPHVVGTVMEQAAVFFDGVVIQNLFDAHYVSVFPNSKECQQSAVRELDGYKVVDAKYDNHVLVVIGANQKTGHYDRFIIRFAPDWASYDVRVIKDVTFVGVNFTTLENGVVVLMNEDESIEIFRNNPGSQSIKVVHDPSLSGDMDLNHRGTEAIFLRDQKVYSISLKKQP